MDVVVVGSCITDLISYTPRLPKPGETLIGHKFSIGFGGKGANQCVAAAKLGARTAMVGKVGEDSFGHNYIQNFKDNGVNIDHVEMLGGTATGAASIAVEDSGQNSIIINLGANLGLQESDVEGAQAVIAAAKVLVCQLEIQPAVTLAALKLARQHTVTTILNPAPAQASLDPQMYTSCDIFCPNETEAEILTGHAVTGVQDAKKALDVLLDKGCKCVIITLGANGSVFASQEDRAPVHVPATKVTPVDTTGAGDSFVGALAYYLTKHQDLSFAEVLRRAGEVATCSVQKPGTQSSYPTRDQLPKELFS